VRDLSSRVARAKTKCEPDSKSDSGHERREHDCQQVTGNADLIDRCDDCEGPYSAARN
jgi:hypothetical protein